MKKRRRRNTQDCKICSLIQSTEVVLFIFEMLDLIKMKPRIGCKIFIEIFKRKTYKIFRQLFPVFLHLFFNWAFAIRKVVRVATTIE